MVRMRTAPTPVRLASAALFALLLALWSLAPAGFMPVFDRGAITIESCPDASPAAGVMHHHHPVDHNATHQPCPYASASSLGGLAADWGPLLLASLVFTVALVLGRTFLFIERHTAGERPPAIGPPIPA